MSDTTSKPADGGPAFPVPGLQHDADFNGMSLRAYAAIKLRVPNSGIGWLDQMIVTSIHNELAKECISAVWRDIPDDAPRALALERLGAYCYEMADAMLKARG